MRLFSASSSEIIDSKNCPFERNSAAFQSIKVIESTVPMITTVNGANYRQGASHLYGDS